MWAKPGGNQLSAPKGPSTAVTEAAQESQQGAKITLVKVYLQRNS